MRTIIIILSAIMAFSASATAADFTETTILTDKKPKRAKAEIKEVTFHVHLHCANCVKKVEENIAFEKGVKDLKVSQADQTVYVKYDSSKTSEQTLKKAIESLGYEVKSESCSGHEHKHNN